MLKWRMLRIRATFLALLTCLLSLPTLAWAAPPSPLDEQGWRRDVPLARRGGDWVVRDTAHFRFYVLSGTAAARDLPLIAQEAEASLRRVQARLAMAAPPRMDVYLVGRVFWQGGAAFGNEAMLLAYLDRNYVDTPLATYLDHEVTHLLAASLLSEGGETSTLLSEGLATWTTGGHYGVEPVHTMAAALPAMGRRVPLQQLREDFRAHQHEIAYIEAASFVGWLIEQYGLDTFKQFYRAADEPERFFGLDYAQLEAAWMEWLEQEEGRDAIGRTIPWWRAQLRLLDTMRGYQTSFDPFARQLPDAPAGWSAPERERYRENLERPLNVALESQLLAASEALACGGDVATVHALLDEVDGVLARETTRGEGDLARRVAVATLLDRQARPLRAVGGAALLPLLRLGPSGTAARDLAGVAASGAVEQETVRLDVATGGQEVVALVAWYPLQAGFPTAHEFTFTLTADGWRLTHISPFPPARLIPRSERLCNR